MEKAIYIQLLENSAAFKTMSGELQQYVVNAKAKERDNFAEIFQREASLHGEINQNFNQEVEKRVKNLSKYVKGQQKDGAMKMEQIQQETDRDDEEKLLQQMNNIK